MDEGWHPIFCTVEQLHRTQRAVKNVLSLPEGSQIKHVEGKSSLGQSPVIPGL